MNQRRNAFGSMTPVVKNLLIINAVLFLLKEFMTQGNVSPLTTHLALYSLKSDFFSPYQIFTHMFMHADFMHILFNMYALWMFGQVLERVWGSKKFLTFYIITGIGAAFLHEIVTYIEIEKMISAANSFYSNPTVPGFEEFMNDYPFFKKGFVLNVSYEWSKHVNSPEIVSHVKALVGEIVKARINIPTVGASGAVFGLLLGFGMLFPNAKLMLIFIPYPIKAKYFVMFYGAFELINGVANIPGDNIAHFAHLGGMLFGYILIRMWRKDQNLTHYN